MIGKLLCAIGRHSFEKRVNPEASGTAGIYYLCRRCGKEKAGYEPPTPGQIAGMAGG
ncbi:MAG: hypothetical protein QOE89_2840 [Pseudonocardiales bacterium]|jgi:hypothetical protein|nr:hypothetical protein [Pseudonocardiales bacterium]